MASLSWDEMTAGKRIARATAACWTVGRVGQVLLALLLAGSIAVPAALAQPAGRGMGAGTAPHAESHQGRAAGQGGHGPSAAGAAGSAETGAEAGIGGRDAEGDDAPGADPASADSGTASPGEDAPGDGDSPGGRATDRRATDGRTMEPPSDQPGAAAGGSADASEGGGGAGSAAADATPAPPGAGEVGLIEAPEDAPGVDADLLPATPDEAAADGSGFWRHGAGAAPAAGAGPAAPAFMFGPIEHPLVVVELFTSQGCSACPPADQMLADLAGRRDVLALSWHVDYWDYLGWADQFARPEFTRRQQAYAHAAGERAIYTPQMIVGGTDTLLSVRPAELMSLIEAQMARPVPVLVTARREAEGYRIELAPRAELPGPIGIVLVRYAPERHITIRAGENRGISVTYRNIVLDATRIGEWDGRAPLRMTIKASPPGDAFPEDTRHAILAQELDDDGDGDGDGDASGPILAAIRLD